jgi:hypothetical protein
MHGQAAFSALFYLHGHVLNPSRDMRTSSSLSDAMGHMPCGICPVSHDWATCPGSHVLCHMSWVTCPVAHVLGRRPCGTCHVSHGLGHMGSLGFWGSSGSWGLGVRSGSSGSSGFVGLVDVRGARLRGGPCGPGACQGLCELGRGLHEHARRYGPYEPYEPYEPYGPYESYEPY